MKETKIYNYSILEMNGHKIEYSTMNEDFLKKKLLKNPNIIILYNDSISYTLYNREAQTLIFINLESEEV